MMRAISIAKYKDDITNEDAVIARNEVVAVSDGAGGGGVFAGDWSDYLVKQLPDEPIECFEAFDTWIDGIWEPFYNEREADAKALGGMFLNKFYDEGSFATLVAVWKDGSWLSYGDSVAFCYNKISDKLQHSFTRLADFNSPPYLINCKDPLKKEGFRKGRFKIDGDSLVFAASDTLAHYILMMYEIAHSDLFADELQDAVSAQTKNSNFIKTAQAMGVIDFKYDVIRKLQNCPNGSFLRNHIRGLLKRGLIGHDDYSLVIM